MESIGAFDAKTRLSELLERAGRGESFVITKHGNPVARLGPVGGVDRDRAAAAAERLKTEFQDMFRGLSVEDLIAMKHEGHRL